MIAELARDPAAVAHPALGLSGDQARAGVPESSTVSPHSDTWSPDGTETGGTMEVTVTGPDGEEKLYLAVAVLHEGEWKILSTIEMTPENA